MRYAVPLMMIVACLTAVVLIVRNTGPALAGPATKPSEAEMKAMNLKQATFAAGCFWGVETTFRKIDGVVSTTVGYTGGALPDPTYRLVCNTETGHAEAVLVNYDPTKVSYPELLDAFWSLHDPTTANRQGPDVGTQYRSVIFTHDAEQDRLARASMAEADASGAFKRKIVTEVVPAAKFYTAEEYHQQYFERRGMAENCHVGIAKVSTKLAADAKAARLAAASAATQPAAAAGASCDPADATASCGTAHWKALSDAELKAKLTPEQYQIARQAGTERAFSGKYWNEHRDGVYDCAVCGQPLFKSDTKFESGTGWPSFYAPVDKSAVTEHSDRAYGMVRTEVLCSRCESHLGHVFDDGPAPTGKRYCMNSAVLELVPSAKPQPAAAK